MSAMDYRNDPSDLGISLTTSRGGDILILPMHTRIQVQGSQIIYTVDGEVVEQQAVSGDLQTALRAAKKAWADTMVRQMSTPATRVVELAP